MPRIMSVNLFETCFERGGIDITCQQNAKSHGGSSRIRITVNRAPDASHIIYRYASIACWCGWPIRWALTPLSSVGTPTRAIIFFPRSHLCALLQANALDWSHSSIQICCVLASEWYASVLRLIHSKNSAPGGSGAYHIYIHLRIPN